MNLTPLVSSYNGKGEQVRRTATGSTVMVHDESGHWLGEYTSDGVPLQQVVWLDDQPVGLLTGAGEGNPSLHYIEADALGTPRTIIEAERNVAVWQWPLKGEAFGKDVPVEDSDGDGIRLTFNLRFPGQRYDAVSGLNYNYFRDYEPITGRYAESDPIGLAGGISTFGYVKGSPLLGRDLYGLLQYSISSTTVANNMNVGQRMEAYPGAGLGEPVTDNTQGRTTIDWSVQARCACASGGFKLDEFTVRFTPTVFMWSSYPHINRGPPIEWVTDKEDEHVADLVGWAQSFKPLAQQAEDTAKGDVYSSQEECERRSKLLLVDQMKVGANQAVRNSVATRHANGGHQWVINP